MTADPIALPPFPFENPYSAQEMLHKSNLDTLVASLAEACCPQVAGFPKTNSGSEACFWRAEQKLTGKSRFCTRPQESESSAYKAVNALLGSSRSAGGCKGTRSRSGHTERMPSRAAGLWASQSTEDYWADASVSLASSCDLDVTKYPGLESCLKPEEVNTPAANVSIEDRNPEDGPKTGDDLVGVQNDLREAQEQQTEEGGDDFAYSSEEEYWSCKEEDTNMAEDTGNFSRYRNFPPPITILATRRDSHTIPASTTRVFWQSIKKNGRFILKEVNVRPQVYYHAHREDGRLRLHLVQPDIEDIAVEGAREEQENDLGAATEREMQQDQKGDWPQMSLVKEERVFRHAEEEESFSKEAEMKSVMPDDLSIAGQEHLLLERGETVLWAASGPEKIGKPSENGFAACYGLNSADYMQDKSSNQATEQQPAALLRNSLTSCEGARGLWAPTQSFLQMSLTRMRPVVG